MPHQTSSGPHLITESPSLIQCRTCRRPVMAATVGGLSVHIDPAALNPLGELSALLEGRSTYNLSGDHLWRRNPETIAAGEVIHPVMATHVCTDIPDEHLNHVWLEIATAIVVKACGGVLVGNDPIAHVPPF